MASVVETFVCTNFIV